MRKFAACGFVAAIAIAMIGLAAKSAGAARGFGLRSLKGTYAGIFTGKAYTGTDLIPINGSGIYVADGRGNLSGHETYTVDTKACDADISGTYKVDPDGSGTDSVTFTTGTAGCSGGSYTQSFAIAKHGKLILMSNTNGDQITEQWYLQR